jgi:uncharacterized membrane protein YdjX (TVP38/TMEM64 family)
MLLTTAIKIVSWIVFIPGIIGFIATLFSFLLNKKKREKYSHRPKGISKLRAFFLTYLDEILIMIPSICFLTASVFLWTL